jgi:hypothetical protein
MHNIFLFHKDSVSVSFFFTVTNTAFSKNKQEDVLIGILKYGKLHK